MTWSEEHQDKVFLNSRSMVDAAKINARSGAWNAAMRIADMTSERMGMLRVDERGHAHLDVDPESWVTRVAGIYNMICRDMGIAPDDDAEVEE